MKNEKSIIVNSTIGSTRIAITNDKVLSDLLIERPDYKKTVGNIYKGKIQNIIPGMQAAFIDIGQPINAFLPFTEIGESDLFDKEIVIENEKKSKKDKKINLQIGDDIVVQVIKEPFSGKGARVTTNISLPGSLIVYIPNSQYIGISKKINDKYEKNRLKSIIKNVKSENEGVIIRTICEGKDKDKIINEYKKLSNTWNELKLKINSSKNISLIYQDFTISDLIIRDLFNSNINQLVVDSKPLYNRLYSLIKNIDKKDVAKLSYHKSKEPIFDKYKLEEPIAKTLKPKVWLKSGAFLIIEHTEAMTVIDVNSGRFIGKKSHEENSLKVNIEASIEIVNQLRIRDIGGLIVIDFIDLADTKNRKKVYTELKKYLWKDHAKSSVSEFSDFGLLQMTRQRIGLNIQHSQTDICSTCSGLGRTLSKDSLLTNIENWINRFRNKFSDRRLIIYVNEEIEKYLKTAKRSSLNKYMFKKLMWIEIKLEEKLNSNEFRVYSKKRKKDVTNEV